MGHFTATEPQRHLGLVAFLEEAAQVAQLDLVVALVGGRTEFDFLDLDDLLLRTSFGLTLLLLVLELTVVHQTDVYKRQPLDQAKGIMAFTEATLDSWTAAEPRSWRLALVVFLVRM